MNKAQKIKNIIAKGETEKAINELLLLTKNDDELYDQCILLSSRFKQWKEKYISGLSNDTIELRRIENGLIQKVNELDKHKIETPESLKEYRIIYYKTLGQNRKRRGIILMIVLIFFVIPFYFWFNINTESFIENYYTGVENNFGMKEEKTVDFDSPMLFLNENVVIIITKQSDKQDIFQLKVRYPKAIGKISGISEISENKPFHFSVVYNPVDVQYIANIRLLQDKIYLVVELNKIFTDSALKKSVPGIKPPFQITQQGRYNTILNLIILFIIPIITGVIANYITKSSKEKK